MRPVLILALLVTESLLYDPRRKKGYQRQGVSTWRCHEERWSHAEGRWLKLLYMRWADYAEGYGREQNLFMDRLVFIHHEGRYEYVLTSKWYNATVHDLTVVVAGVIVHSSLVLSALNPFRRIIRYKFKKYFTTICTMHERAYRWWSGNVIRYHTRNYQVACARAIIPYTDYDTDPDKWHGYPGLPRLHTPMHDLIVFRTEKPIYDLKPWSMMDNINSWSKTNYQYLPTGPIITKIASTNTSLVAVDMQFGMIGHSFDKNPFKRRNMYTVLYSMDDNVATNCDAWIPREWGWFICLRNIYSIPRLAAGAMLYANGSLFGVGSFTLFKGNVSILVFTDVRKYYYLINCTCTREDQELKDPTTTTTTTTRKTRSTTTTKKPPSWFPFWG